MDKFLGYLLPRADNNVHGMRYVKPLSEEQYAEFEEVIRVTSILRPHIVNFMGLEENFNVFQRLPGEMKSQFEALSNSMSEGAVGGARRIAKSQNALSSFLFSAGAFRDRARMRLRERYGSDDPRVAEWDAVVSAAYDAHFEYRLFYNLRNYAQHHDIPLSLVPLQSKLNDKSKMEATVSVVLAPSKIASSPLVQKRFRPQLVGLSADIDLNPVAAVYFRLHAGFLKAIIEMHKEEVAQMHAYREALVSHLKLPAGAFPVIWEGDFPLNDGETTDGRFTHFSFDELNLILVLHEHLTRLTTVD
ncbi:MAG: hypothetical protein WAV72_05730 [Bradyrhizobium sp.]